MNRHPSHGPTGPVPLRIESIAAGGDGVSHLSDGRVAFVPRTAPGDLVETRIVKVGARWARALPLRVLEPGPDRREPPCVFADRCGGCALEHLTYRAQLSAKARVIADALTRIAKRPVELPDVVPSPREERYRNRVSFSLRRLSGRAVVGGFRAWDDPGRIVDVDERCLLFEDSIARAWSGMRKSWGEGARRLPGGRELRLTLRGTVAGQVSLLVEDGEGEGDPAGLLEAVEDLASIWMRGADGAVRCVAGASEVEDEWEGVRVPLRAAAFTQVNRSAAEGLEAYVDTLVGEPARLRIIDAYAGVGLRALRWARRGAHAHAIELDREAAAAGEGLLSASGATMHPGRVEEVMERLLPADLVVLNPPRGGIAAEIASALTEHPPARIVYVSCDPATLARDILRLGERFSLDSVRGFDLFPQTAHVETVVMLERA